MLSLMKKIIKSGKITVGWKQVSAEGGLAILIVFILILVVLLKA